MSNGDCLFCRIAKGELPADIVLERDGVVAFRDINPQAPTHVLVIPAEHLASLQIFNSSLSFFVVTLHLSISKPFNRGLTPELTGRSVKHST